MNDPRKFWIEKSPTFTRDVGESPWSVFCDGEFVGAYKTRDEARIRCGLKPAKRVQHDQQADCA